MATQSTQLDQSAPIRLASYQRCVARLRAAWPPFADRRRQRLRQGLFDAPAEKVAENVLEDLFTTVLDWSLDDVALQVGRADLVLSDHGVKRLVLEVKRPGALLWHRAAVARALDQALGYAARQRVDAVAVSDGTMLYAADVVNGGLADRVLVALDAPDPPLELWWVSVHGIYRSPPATAGHLSLLPDPPPTEEPSPARRDAPLLHHRYGLPATCFAFVGAGDDPRTWKLPYLLADGSPDAKRLPKAIQSILSNYRGTKVTLPRSAVPDVLTRLAGAARTARKLPCQDASTAAVYVEAHRALHQLGRLGEVGCCAQGGA
ncbi:MAG TPA: hypothetical protein VE152_01140 [Acidimicrobiales bacterium]|nr:hypothetical protein [Acidimicrobiales bacterium]